MNLLLMLGVMVKKTTKRIFFRGLNLITLRTRQYLPLRGYVDRKKGKKRI